MLLSGKRLDGSQVRQFREALKGAFDPSSFARMLRDRLNLRLEDIIVTKGSSFPDIIDKVIEHAEQESLTTQLLQGARDERPDDASLFFFAQLFNLALPDFSLQTLEGTVKPHNKYHDIAPLIKRLTELEAQVCHIEDSNGVHLGTGFLLGPGIVITCYHVVKAFIQHSPERIVCRFDYKVMSDGMTLNEGVRYHALQWIDYSEGSPLDLQAPHHNVSPKTDQLDYALFYLKHFPDNDKNGQHDIMKRGWIVPVMREYDFQPKSAIFIIHHPTPPYGSPRPHDAVMKYSQDTEAVLCVNQNRTRVIYTTNTKHGSSGAPCFNEDWDVVALHQSGDSLTKNFRRPEYNQGIPFFAILTLLESRGKRKLLDAPYSLEGNRPMNDMNSEAPVSPSHPSHEQKAIDGVQASEHLEAVDSPTPPLLHRTDMAEFEEPMDRNALLDRLHKSTPDTINKIISYFQDIPDEISDESSKAKKINMLIRWVEHPDGPGLKDLYDKYQRVIGKKKTQN